MQLQERTLWSSEIKKITSDGRGIRKPEICSFQFHRIRPVPQDTYSIWSTVIFCGYAFSIALILHSQPFASFCFYHDAPENRVKSEACNSEICMANTAIQIHRQGQYIHRQGQILLCCSVIAACWSTSMVQKPFQEPLWPSCTFMSLLGKRTHTAKCRIGVHVSRKHRACVKVSPCSKTLSCVCSQKERYREHEGGFYNLWSKVVEKWQ